MEQQIYTFLELTQEELKDLSQPPVPVRKHMAIIGAAVCVGTIAVVAAVIGIEKNRELSKEYTSPISSVTTAVHAETKKSETTAPAHTTINSTSTARQTTTAISTTAAKQTSSIITSEADSSAAEIPLQLSLSESSCSIEYGGQHELTAALSKEEEHELVWSSSDKSVVTVNNGLLQAVAPGSAKIKVKIKDTDISAVCKVTVNHMRTNMVSLKNSTGAAILADRSLYTWGMNTYGMLGDGTTSTRSKPMKILDNISSVSMGAFSCAALTEDGSLYTWGDNSTGALGDGTDTNKYTPTKILENIKQVSMGFYEGGAVDKDGNLYFWGNHFSFDTTGNRIFTP